MISRILIIVTFVVVLLVGCAVVASSLAGAVDDLLLDEDAARLERLRLAEVERQRQETQEALALAEEAQYQVEIERERTAQEEALQRQMEYRVEWQRAAGDKAEADANAYTTRRMADASYKAIQRQGHLLALSHLQYIFFGGVMMAGLVGGGLLALVWYADRRAREWKEEETPR